MGRYQSLCKVRLHTEEKFYDKVKDIIIFKNLSGEYITLKEYIEANKDKNQNKIFYVTDETQQAQYIKMFKESGMDAIIMNNMIDSHFINFLEMKFMQENNDAGKDGKDGKDEPLRFARIDSELSDSLKNSAQEADEKDAKALKDKFEKFFREALSNDKLNVKTEQLKVSNVPAMILQSEHSRRFQEMSRLYGGGNDNAFAGMFEEKTTLVLNSGSPLIQSLGKIIDDNSRADDAKLICQHIYDLALMAHKPILRIQWRNSLVGAER